MRLISVHAIIIFDEMQNGAIWSHFRVSYNIESMIPLSKALCTTLDSVNPVLYPFVKHASSKRYC
jgi:hypothetical protein